MSTIRKNTEIQCDLVNMLQGTEWGKLQGHCLHFGGKWIKKSLSQITQQANFSEIEKK
jgi:hypothetical protein